MIKDNLTTKELAEILGISRVAVFNKIKNGQIPARKVGGKYLISKKNVDFLISDTISEEKKAQIDEGLKKVLNEYKETIQLLGKE